MPQVAGGIWPSISQIGYNLGLPGMGISLPAGTPYSADRAPATVYNPTTTYAVTQPTQKQVTTVQNKTLQTPGTGLGDVLGATTGGGTTQPQQTQSDPNAGQPSQPSYEDMVRGMFDEAIGNLGGQQQEQQNNINGIANSQKTGIDEQVAAMQPQYGIYKDNINTQGTKSLADLAAEMRGASQNMMNFLGGRNAGNTSAVPGVAYALSKEFGKNRANIMGQVNQQLSEIDLAENNLKSKAVEMKNQVDTWANSQIAQIAQQFQSMRGQLDMGKRNALIDYLGQIEDQKRQLTATIQQQGMQRLQELNNMKLQLQNSGNFDPRAIMSNEFTFDDNTARYANDFTNSIYVTRRDDQQTI